MSSHSCVYEGVVTHERLAPRRHTFNYRVCLLYIDLDQLDNVFDDSWLASSRYPAPAWFRRSDHMGDPSQSLVEAIRDQVERHNGKRPKGPIRLLTHLRYFGYVFNPVSFYYCFELDGSLAAVVAEVDNTPWGERHVYVLDDTSACDGLLEGEHRYVFPKALHVSPFMGMQQQYDWRFDTPGERLRVKTISLEADKRVFEANLTLTRRSLTPAALRRVLFRYPLMTAQVMVAIYLQAARLALKRTPFFIHPKKRIKQRTSEASQT